MIGLGLSTVENLWHYNDVILIAMAYEITSPVIVYPLVYPGADQRKHQSSLHWPLCGEFTGDRFMGYDCGIVDVNNKNQLSHPQVTLE